MFEGTVSLEHNGGFASVRTSPGERGLPGAGNCLIELRGDNKEFKLSLLTDDGFDSLNYQASFTPKGSCGRSRRGAFLLRRRTRRDCMRAALAEVKAQLRLRRHDSIADQGQWLRLAVTGDFAYHAVPSSAHAIGADRHHVLDLQRRSQKDRTTWLRMDRLAAEWLPPPHVLHPWPEERLSITTRGRSRMP